MNIGQLLRLGLFGFLSGLFVWPAHSDLNAATMAATTIPSGYVDKKSQDGACVVKIKPVDSNSLKKIFVKSIGNDCVVLNANQYVGTTKDLWWKPAEITTVRVLVVGGGGNGGACSNPCGANGGSGGQVIDTTLNFGSVGAFTIDVRPAARSNPSNGSGNASFFGNNIHGKVSASGGSNGAPAGIGSANPGNTFGGAGGSGSVGNGQVATSSAGGTGGVGFESDITGTSIRYGGGGGGVGLCVGCAGGAGVDGGGDGGKLGLKGTTTSLLQEENAEIAMAFSFGGGGGGSSGTIARASGSQGVVIWRFERRVAPTWTDRTIMPMTSCVAYTDGVLASGVPAPTYSVTSGSIPAGLTLNSTTGAITGTPTVSGPYGFTITATNSAGSISQAFLDTIDACSDLQISVSSPGNNVVPGAKSTVTISVFNNGPDTASNVSVEYTLPNGVVAVDPPCDIGPKVTCGPLLTVPTGTTRSWVIPIKVLGTASSGLTSLGSATTSSDTFDPQLSNNTTSANFTIANASADLVIEQSGDTTFAPGATGKQVKLRMYNNGLSDAVGAKIEFSLVGTHITPTAVTITRGAGTCDPIQTNPYKVICYFTGSMAPLDQTKSISDAAQDVFDIVITVDADNSPHGTSVGTTSIASSSTNDPDTSNNTSNVVLMFIDLRPDLSVRISIDPNVVVPGGTADVTVIVENGGSVSSDGPISTVIVLPAGIDTTTLGSGCTKSSPGSSPRSVTCVDANGLANGASKTFVFVIEMSESETDGTIYTLAGTVDAATTSVNGASGNETNLANNTTSAKARADIPISDLVLSVSRPQSLKAGEAGSVVLAVMNNGPSVAVDSSVLYTLPKLVNLNGALPNGCSQSGVTIACVRSAALAKGATISYTINVLVDVSAPSGLTSGGAMSVSTSSVESSLSSNAATNVEANLDVVGLAVQAETAPVKVEEMPDTGTQLQSRLILALFLIGAGCVILWMTRRRLV